SLDNGGFGNLNPLASVRELGESSREGRGALAPNLDAVDLLAVLAWTLNDGSHVRVSLGGRVTLSVGEERICTQTAPCPGGGSPLHDQKCLIYMPVKRVCTRQRL